MRIRFMTVLTAVVALSAQAQTPQGATLTKDEADQMYTLGVFLSRNIQTFDFTDAEMAMVKAGLDDGAHARPKLEQDVMKALLPKLQALQSRRVEAAATREKDVGTAYLAFAATERGAVKLASGLIYKVLSEGTGETPQETDSVTVLYTGRFVDGMVFDKSGDLRPSTFPIGAVIPCWNEGLRQIRVGGKSQFVCPPHLAFGAEGSPPEMRPNATLIYEVELLKVTRP